MTCFVNCSELNIRGFFLNDPCLGKSLDIYQRVFLKRFNPIRYLELIFSTPCAPPCASSKHPTDYCSFGETLAYRRHYITREKGKTNFSRLSAVYFSVLSVVSC